MGQFSQHVLEILWFARILVTRKKLRLIPRSAGLHYPTLLPYESIHQACHLEQVLIVCPEEKITKNYVLKKVFHHGMGIQKNNFKNSYKIDIMVDAKAVTE